MKNPTKAEKLAKVESAHGIIAEKHAGAGHRYSHRAYKAHIRSPRGETITALAYVTRYGFEALVSFKHAAEGNSPEEAVEKLCKANNITI